MKIYGILPFLLLIFFVSCEDGIDFSTPLTYENFSQDTTVLDFEGDGQIDVRIGMLRQQVFWPADTTLDPVFMTDKAFITNHDKVWVSKGYSYWDPIMKGDPIDNFLPWERTFNIDNHGAMLVFPSFGGEFIGLKIEKDAQSLFGWAKYNGKFTEYAIDLTDDNGQVVNAGSKRKR